MTIWFYVKTSDSPKVAGEIVCAFNIFQDAHPKGKYSWIMEQGKGEEEYWRRPEKDGPGISATVNYQGSGLLYVFSTNAQFEPNRGYSKFSAYSVLNHGGDFSAASHHAFRPHQDCRRKGKP